MTNMNMLKDSPYKNYKVPSDRSLLEFAEFYKPDSLGLVEPELRSPPPRPNMWCPISERHIKVETPFTSWHAVRGWVVFDKRNPVPKGSVSTNVVAYEWQNQIRLHKLIKPYFPSDEYGVRDGDDKIWFDKTMRVGTPVTVLVNPGHYKNSNEIYDPLGVAMANPAVFANLKPFMSLHSEVVYGYFDETLYLTWSDIVGTIRDEEYGSPYRQSAIQCIRYILTDLAVKDPSTLVKALQQAKITPTGKDFGDLSNEALKIVACAYNKEKVLHAGFSNPDIKTLEDLTPILNHIVLKAFGPT